MIETMRPEPIQPKKATFTDKAISWMVDSWQKIKPGEKSFSERENQVTKETPGSPTKEALVLEKDLPVVEEALQVGRENREAGTIISKEINPLGEDVTDLTMMIFGDSHIPGSDRKESPYELNEKPYRIFKKIRLLFLGIKEKINTTIGKKSERNSGTFDFQNLEEKTDFFDGVDNFQAFYALKMTLARKAHELKKTLTSESKVLVVNVGDNSDGHDKMGDIALSALNLDSVRDEVAHNINVPTFDAVTGEVVHNINVLTKMTHLKGNHDTDLNNHGLEHDQFHRDLFGEQIFLQEIGKDCLLLAINTNFYSTFWHEHLERRKQKGLTEKDQQILEKIRIEMTKQNMLIQKAVDSGKRIIFMGHERGYMEQALGKKWKESGVVAVISGHTHKHENFEGKNKNGQTIHFLNVGATKEVNVDGEKKRVLSGFALRVKDSADSLSLEIDEVVPSENDYQEAKYRMTG